MNHLILQSSCLMQQPGSHLVALCCVCSWTMFSPLSTKKCPEVSAWSSRAGKWLVSKQPTTCQHCAGCVQGVGVCPLAVRTSILASALAGLLTSTCKLSLQLDKKTSNPWLLLSVPSALWAGVQGHAAGL